MRSTYPLSSNELNDRLFSAYENLTYLLGFESEDDPIYSGVYDHLETSGNAMLVSQSGIPGTLSPKMLEFLKYDYIYRKHYKEIQYMERPNVR